MRCHFELDFPNKYETNMQIIRKVDSTFTCTPLCKHFMGKVSKKTTTCTHRKIFMHRNIFMHVHTGRYKCFTIDFSLPRRLSIVCVLFDNKYNHI